MKLGRVEGSPCPNCRRLLNAVGHPDAVPKPGDLTVCLYCGHLCAFGDDMLLRDPTDEEIVEVAGSVELIGAQGVRAAFLREHPEKNRAKG